MVLTLFIPDTSDLDLVWVLLLCAAAEEEGGAGGGARSPSTDTWTQSEYTIYSIQYTKATVNSIHRIFMNATQKVFGEKFTRQRQSKSSKANA